MCMKQLAGGKHMENDCFPRTLKFEMKPTSIELSMAMTITHLDVS
jgi:hypothetical protein